MPRTNTMPRQRPAILLDSGPLGERYDPADSDPAFKLAGLIQSACQMVRDRLISNRDRLARDGGLSPEGKARSLVKLGNELLTELERETAGRLDQVTKERHGAHNRVELLERTEAESGDQVLRFLQERQRQDLFVGRDLLEIRKAVMLAIERQDPVAVRAVLYAPPELGLADEDTLEELKELWFKARWPKEEDRADDLHVALETVTADVESTETAIREVCVVPKEDSFFVGPEPRTAA